MSRTGAVTASIIKSEGLRRSFATPNLFAPTNKMCLTKFSNNVV